ncbi:MAG: 30S ribosomal protein S1 [Anaerolineales bacterium]|jgi:small subunit ribosomal protein S1
MITVNQEELVDQIKSGEEDFRNSFEETLDNYIYQLPERGQILEGEIQAIQDDSIILDVGLKRAAIVPGREVGSLDDEIITNLSVGDLVPIKVTHTPVGDQDLLVSIDDAMEIECWKKAKDYLTKDQLLELEVIGSNRGGVLVNFEKLEGFVPNSHIPALKKVYGSHQIRQYKQQLKGEDIKVKVIDVDRSNERLIFSALEAQRELRQERLQNLEVGDVITGKVVNVVDFGLFVDIGNIDGLVHKSQLDWQRITHPSNVAKVGDDIEVKVIDIDLERERIGLSRKALLPDPWDEIESSFVTGDLVEVEIISVADFGVFAKLTEGVQGLIHNSQLGYSAPGTDRDVLEPGMTVLVKILSIEPKRERISLSMQKVPLDKQIEWLLGEFDQDTESAEPAN